MVTTTVDQLIFDAFDKLNLYYNSEGGYRYAEKKGQDFKAKILVLQDILKIEKSVELSIKQSRIIPPQLTPQRLAEYLGEADLIWVLEDFHKVEPEERTKLAQIFKIFVDASNLYKNIKIVAIGAVGTAREVVNYDPELNTRVSEIHVPLMSVEEMLSVIEKGENLLKISFSEKSKKEIIRFSNSLASICHHLCFSICHNNNILETNRSPKVFDEKVLEDAVLDYLKQNSDSFKETLDRALKQREGIKCDNMKQIIMAFCNSKKEELTKGELQNYKDNKKKFPNIIDCLKLLTTSEYGEIIRLDENSGRFSFSNPFFKAYSIMHFRSEDNEEYKDHRKLDLEMLFEILNRQSLGIEILNKPLMRK